MYYMARTAITTASGCFRQSVVDNEFLVPIFIEVHVLSTESDMQLVHGIVCLVNAESILLKITSAVAAPLPDLVHMSRNLCLTLSVSNTLTVTGFILS